MIAQKWLIAASSQVFLYFIATAEDDSQFAIFMYLNAFDHLTDDGIIISAFVLFTLVNGFLYSSVGAWLGYGTGRKLRQITGECYMPKDLLIL